MKTILIDDEPIALEVLELMLSPYESINIIGKYTRYTDALESLKEEKPDIIFLDIEMGDMNGLKLAEIFIRELDKVEIVFVTAYSEYAVDAFELNAIDYLLKPIQENRLLKAVERLKEKIAINKIQSFEKNKSELRVLSFGGFQVVDNEENYLSWRTQKSKEIFAYLWDRKDRPASKDSIIEDIFPGRDVDKATTLLHTTIYQLRKSLERLGYSNGINYFDESYQLNIPTTGDREELNKIISLGRYSEEDIKDILMIYRGEFLEEGYLWGMEKQQIYRQFIFGILEKFTREKVEAEIFNLILKVSLDKAYEIDPFNESIVETKIHYYGRQNKISNLETFYNNYKEELWDEMKLEPKGNIINIYKEYVDNF